MLKQQYKEPGSGVEEERGRRGGTMEGERNERIGKRKKKGREVNEKEEGKRKDRIRKEKKGKIRGKEVCWLEKVEK